MAIVERTANVNAIATLSDLIDEVRDEMDDDGFAQPRIMKAIARSEARFNREFRVPQMEVTVDLAVTDGRATLPDDCLEVRYVRDARYLDSTGHRVLDHTFMDATGTPRQFAINGSTLTAAPTTTGTLSVTYFQRIPSLTEAKPSNWLLQQHSDLYLHHALALLFNKIADPENAASNLAIANEIVEQVKMDGRARRYGAGPLVPRGIQQVYGARA